MALMIGRSSRIVKSEGKDQPEDRTQLAIPQNCPPAAVVWLLNLKLHVTILALFSEEIGDMADWSDWTFAQSDPSDELSQLHFYTMKKHQNGQIIEFRITVREFVDRNDLGMRFYAEADKQTNQKTDRKST